MREDAQSIGFCIACIEFEGPAMTDVFISYASSDRERARTLASALATRGWSVWWDRNIKAGQIFDEVIEHELETAKKIIVLWSTDSISSEWVKNEAAVAAERGVLVPVLIDSIKVPLEFRRKQTANLIGWNGDSSHSGFQALCEALEVTTTPDPAILRGSPTQLGRRIRWGRTWILVAISGIIILPVGSYLLFHDSEDAKQAIRDAPSVSPAPAPSHRNLAYSKQQDPNYRLPTDLQSSEKGVFVDITSFEKRGELTTLELMFRSTSDKSILVCSGASQARLIDEVSGESWGAVHSGGPVKGCDWIGGGKSSGAWIKFKITDPEKRHLSLSIPSLSTTPELLLPNPSGK